MDDTEKNYRVPDMKPTRPSKLTVIGLAGLVIAFFVVVLTAPDKELEELKKAAVKPPVATTQTR